MRGISDIKTTISPSSNLNDRINIQEVKMRNAQETILSGDQKGNYDNIARPALYDKLQADMNTLDTRKKDNTYLKTKMDVMLLNVSSIYKLAEEAQKVIDFASSDQPMPDTSVNIRLKTIMSQFTELLNESYDGRYIYGGSTSSLKPIQQPLANLPIGDTTYTDVNTNPKNYNLDDKVSVSVQLNPLLPGFQKLIDTINYLLKADTTKSQDPNLLQARALIPSAMRDIQDVKTKLSTIVQAFDQQLENTQTYQAELEKNIKSEGFQSLAQLLVNLSEQRVSNDILMNLTLQGWRSMKEYLSNFDI